MQITGTHHIALCTPNFATIQAFYTQTLGLPIVGGFPGRKIIFIAAGTTTIELVEREEPLVLGRQGWAHFAFQVENVDASFAELSAQGISFHIAPKDFPETAPSIRIAFFKDPDGNEIELVQPLSDDYPQPSA